MTRHLAHYRTFLISLWEEPSSDRVWRCRLEDPHTGRQIGFSSPEALTHFLRQTAMETPMSTTLPPSAHLLPPGAGEMLNGLGVSLTVKTSGALSAGQWFVMEYTAPPQFAGPPPHFHKVMTELFYVLEGVVTFHVGEQTLEAGLGGYVFVPPGTVHSFTNQTTAPARLLCLCTPALLEPYFHELTELVRSAPQWPLPDMRPVLALMAKHDTYPPAAN